MKVIAIQDISTCVIRSGSQFACMAICYMGLKISGWLGYATTGGNSFYNSNLLLSRVTLGCRTQA